MKKRNFLLGLALSLVMLPVVAKDLKVDTQKSTIAWEGKKVTGAHHGFIQLKSGSFILKNDKINSGTFVIDMASMSNEDLKDSPDMMNKLMGHLKSDDFFGVASYPVATFEIKSSTAFKNGKATVKADLTIKKDTHPISFEVSKSGNKYTSTIVVDRTLYNVRYGSGKFFDNLGDKTIYDDFTLDVTLITE